MDETQFQIGDAVLYSHESIVTTVVGYVWNYAVGGLPEITAYKLDCGISVPRNALVYARKEPLQ